MTDLASLIREVKANGVAVRRTNGGHYAFNAPDGTQIIAPSTPQNDHHAVVKLRTDLKAHGYEGKGDAKASRRHRTARGATAVNELAIQVLARMQEKPGQGFRPSELAQFVERPLKDVANALATLKRTHPEVSNPERGVWIYSVDPFHAPIVAPPEKVPKARAWGTRAHIEKYLKEHPREMVSVAALAEGLGVSPANVSQSLTALQKALGPELEKKGRGKYIYNPKHLGEEARIRVRLRMIERELEHRDITPLVRNMLIAEQAQLKEKLDRLVNPPEPEPVAAPQQELTPMAVSVPAEPVRPITVMPTALPDDAPALFEAVTIHRSGAVILRDENQELWLAHPIRIELPEVGLACNKGGSNG